MQTLISTYDMMNDEYRKVIKLTMKKFLREIGMDTINSGFQNRTKNNLLYKLLERHCKLRLKDYVHKGYFNPIDVLSNCKVDEIYYGTEGLAVHLEYNELLFNYSYSLEKKRADLSIIHKGVPLRPIIFHPEAIQLIEGIILEYTSNLINLYDEASKINNTL